MKHRLRRSIPDIQQLEIQDRRLFIVLVEWQVDPQHQRELIDRICDLVEKYIKSDLGFISASFHASEDGRRVINYAQWRSKADWSKSRASGDDEATMAIADAISRCGAKILKVETFRIDRVVESGNLN
jgi:quinol monooxygenase YgiN